VLHVAWCVPCQLSSCVIGLIKCTSGVDIAVMQPSKLAWHDQRCMTCSLLLGFGENVTRLRVPAIIAGFLAQHHYTCGVYRTVPAVDLSAVQVIRCTSGIDVAVMRPS
jgi:hypothetical protein